MPGHVKRGGTGEPDPDPTEYLFITYEEKQKVSGQYFVCETIVVLGPCSCKAVLLRTFFTFTNPNLPRTLQSRTTRRRAAGSR